MSKEIKWGEVRSKYGKKITYKNLAINHGSHVSVMKEMFIDGELKRQDLVHIPSDIVNEINKEVNIKTLTTHEDQPISDFALQVRELVTKDWGSINVDEFIEAFKNEVGRG